MALIPNEVKKALAYLRSIDISLGRIATALEEKNEANISPETLKKIRDRKKNKEDEDE